MAWGAGAYQALERLAHKLGAGDADGLTQYPGRDSEPVAPLPSLTAAAGGSSADSSLALPVSLLSPSRPLIAPPRPGARGNPGTQLPSGPATLDALKATIGNNPLLFLGLGLVGGLGLALALRR